VAAVVTIPESINIHNCYTDEYHTGDFAMTGYTDIRCMPVEMN
jgi:hypothetical protein